MTNSFESTSIDLKKKNIIKNIQSELDVVKTETIKKISNESCQIGHQEREALKKEVLAQQSDKIDGNEALNPQEKAEMKGIVEKLFQEMLESVNQIGYQASKLGTIRVFLETKLDDIDDPNSWGNWGAKKMASIKSFFGSSTDKEAMTKEKEFITKFLEQDIEKVAEKVMNGENLEDILSSDTNIKALLEQNDISLKVPNSRAGILKEKINLITHLRKNSQYEAAQAEMENSLAKHFEKARADFAKNNPVELAKMEKKAEKRVAEMMETKAAQSSWTSPQKRLQDLGAKPMTAEEMKRSRENLIAIEKRKMMNKEAGKLIKENEGNINFTAEEQTIWSMYDDMLDPGDSLWNISDESQDMILEELVINAPLIIMSGGIASLARAGVTAGVRSIAGRNAVKWAGKNFARKSAFWAAGTVVEGASFEAAHIALGKMTGLNEEDLSAISGMEWAERIFWSSATLGAFHGTGKVVGRIFQKETVIAGKKVMSKTALTKGIEKLTHPGLQKTITKLVQGGTAVNLEAATMLMTGAAQHGYYSGDWEEYMDHFGEHVGHAFVSVMALKTSGKIIHPLIKPLNRLNQKLAGNSGNISLSKLTPEQLRKSELSQADRQKEAGDFLINKKFREKPLTYKQGEVLQKAHEYNDGGSMGNYSFAELKAKMKILKKDGVFTGKEAKALLSKEGSFAGTRGMKYSMKARKPKQSFDTWRENVDIQKKIDMLGTLGATKEIIDKQRYFVERVSYEQLALFQKNLDVLNFSEYSLFRSIGELVNGKVTAEHFKIFKAMFPKEKINDASKFTRFFIKEIYTPYYLPIKNNKVDLTTRLKLKRNLNRYLSNGYAMVSSTKELISRDKKRGKRLSREDLFKSERELDRKLKRGEGDFEVKSPDEIKTIEDFRKTFELVRDIDLYLGGRYFKKNTRIQELYKKDALRKGELMNIAYKLDYFNPKVWNLKTEKKHMKEFFEKDFIYLDKYVENSKISKKERIELLISELGANGSFKNINIMKLSVIAKNKELSSKKRKEAIQKIRETIFFAEKAGGDISNLFQLAISYCENNNLKILDYKNTLAGEMALKLIETLPRTARKMAKKSMKSFEVQLQSRTNFIQSKTKKTLFLELFGLNPLSENYEIKSGPFGIEVSLIQKDLDQVYAKINNSPKGVEDYVEGFKTSLNGYEVIVSSCDINGKTNKMNEKLINKHETEHAIHSLTLKETNIDVKERIFDYYQETGRRNFLNDINGQIIGRFENSLNLAKNEIFAFKKNGDMKEVIREVLIERYKDLNLPVYLKKGSYQFAENKFTKREIRKLSSIYGKFHKAYDKIVERMIEVSFQKNMNNAQLRNIPIKDWWKYSNGKYKRTDFLIKRADLSVFE